MTAYAVTDTVTVDNVVRVTGSVAIDNVSLSASFNVTVPTAVNQGSGASATPWWITSSGSLSVGNAPYAPLWLTVTSSLPVLAAGTVQTWTSGLQGISGTVSVSSIAQPVSVFSAGTVGVSGSVTANVTTTGSAGLAVGNSSSSPLWVTLTGSFLAVSASVTTPTNPIGQIAAGVDRAGKIQYLPILSGGLPQSQGYNATRSFVSSSTSDVLLLSGNVNRMSVIIYNDSNSSLYVGFGQTAVSTDDFTTVISAQSERNLSYDFKGELRGVWKSATGVARITEVT